MGAIGADGAFVKAAELLPGADAIAFAVHVQNGDYAHALRSISRASCLRAEAREVALHQRYLRFGCVSFFHIDTEELGITPKTPIHVVGVANLIMDILQMDDAAQCSSEGDLAARIGVQESVLSCLNRSWSSMMDSVVRAVPQNLEWLVDFSEKYLREVCSAPFFLPVGALPRRSVALDVLAVAFQDGMRSASTRHGSAALLRPVEREVTCSEQTQKRGLALFALGCSFLVSGFLTLFTFVCLLGVLFALAPKWVQRLEDIVECHNRETWQRLRERAAVDGPASDDGLIMEMEQHDINRCVAALRSYLHGDVLRTPVLRTCVGFLEHWVPVVLLRLMCADDVRLQLIFETEIRTYRTEADVPLVSPALPLPVVVDFSISGGGAVQVRRLRTVIHDSSYATYWESIRAQLAEVDLRTMDQRFRDFTEPVYVAADLTLEWQNQAELKFIFQNVRCTLNLP